MPHIRTALATACGDEYLGDATTDVFRFGN